MKTARSLNAATYREAVARVVELPADRREDPGHPGHEMRNGQHLHRVQPNLRRCSALGALAEPQLRAMEAVARVFEVKRPNVIFREGDPSDRIFLLKSGVVKLKLARVCQRGGEAILAFACPGDMFGELALVDDAPRDHDAQAHEDAVVYAIDREPFLHFIRESPAVAFQMTRLVAQRLRQYRTRVQALHRKHARARVAGTLLDLAAQQGVVDAQGVLIPLRLSQRDLANLAGLTRETVNFTLQNFRKLGLVEADRHSIRLNNPEALRLVL